MRLKVNNVLLDQFQNTIIAQNYETNNFGDISTSRGGFSNDFTIPLSSKNDAALGYPSDINIGNRNPYQKIDAQLIDQGAVIAIGYIRYKVVEGKKIQCSFFADNTEWFNLIKDKKMSDIDLSDYNHEWTSFNITQSFTNTEGYIYPVIDYGYYIDANIDDGTGQTVVDDITMYPAMFVSSLVNQIFTDIGWNVSGSLLSEERYQRMIQPFSAEDFAKPESQINSDSIIVDDTTPLLISNSFTSSGSVDWSGYGTDVNVTNEGVYNIQVNLNYSWTTGTANQLIFRIRKNGTNIYSVQRDVVNNNTGEVILISNNELLSPTDDIDVFCEVAFAGNGLATIEGTLNIISQADYVSGSEIIMSSTMPDISQADFLKYIFFSFGVVPQPDNYSKTVSLDFFKEIEDNIPNAVDWSKKLDTSKSINTDFTELLNKYSRESILNYEEDEDDAELSSYKAETKLNFGQGQINIDNDHLDPRKEIYKSPYSPMINILSFNNELYIPQIKYWQYDDDESDFVKEFKPSPKIGLITDAIDWTDLTVGFADTFKVNSTGSSSSFVVSEVPFCWFVKTPYITEVNSYDFSLAYDQVQFPNVTDSTLIETYIEDYEKVLNTMKYVKAYFRINEVDINNLDFLTPVYIDRFKSYFYINKIKNYQGANKTTEVELIKLSSNG